MSSQQQSSQFQHEQESAQLLSGIIANTSEEDYRNSNNLCVDFVPCPGRGYSISAVKEAYTKTPKMACDLSTFVRQHH